MIHQETETAKDNTLWLTVPEAAFLLGITERAVQLRAKKGALQKKRARSAETGRLRLLVSSPELCDKMNRPSQDPLANPTNQADFIPRFSNNFETDASVGEDEFSALTAHLKVLDQGLEKDRRRLGDLETQRDRLAQALARAKASLETERSLSSQHEQSLHRFIDKQEVRHRTRETQIHDQVSRLARALGRAEHLILEIKTRKTWWRRFADRIIHPFRGEAKKKFNGKTLSEEI